MKYVTLKIFSHIISMKKKIQFRENLNFKKFSRGAASSPHLPIASLVPEN